MDIETTMDTDARIDRIDDAVRQTERAHSEMLRRLSVLEEKLSSLRTDISRLNKNIDDMLKDRRDSLKRIWPLAISFALTLSVAGFELGQILEKLR